MNTLTLALGMALAIGSGVAHADTIAHDLSQHQMTMQMASNEAGHKGVGVLKAVNAKAGKVQISHEAIADLNWPAMTMWFAMRESLPQDIKIGDAVRFELMQGEKNQWMVVKIARK